VQNGSVIVSGGTIYFIATGLGVQTFEGSKVILLSPMAPMSALLRGKVKGDKMELKNGSFEIADVF
jgi:hypothetical protein